MNLTAPPTEPSPQPVPVPPPGADYWRKIMIKLLEKILETVKDPSFWVVA